MHDLHRIFLNIFLHLFVLVSLIFLVIATHMFLSYFDAFNWSFFSSFSTVWLMHYWKVIPSGGMKTVKLSPNFNWIEIHYVQCSGRLHQSQLKFDNIKRKKKITILTHVSQFLLNKNQFENSLKMLTKPWNVDERLY